MSRLLPAFGSAQSFGARSRLIPAPVLSAPDPLAGLMALRLQGKFITGVSDGGLVSTIPNHGTTGAANDAVQPVSLQWGVYKASNAAFNNQPTVRLDASDDGYSTGLALTNPYTIIFVARAVNTSLQSSGNRTINSEDHNSLISINRNGAAVYNENVITDLTTSNGTIAHVMSLAVGAQSRCYIDGVDVTGGLGATGDWGRISIGAVGANAEPANADIAAIGVFLGVDDTTRLLIESTWKAEYGTP